MVIITVRKVFGMFSAEAPAITKTRYFGISRTDAIGELVCGNPGKFGGIKVEYSDSTEKSTGQKQ